MENKYSRELMILPSICDSSAALSVPDTFALFMDAASEHAKILGFSTEILMPRGLFWVTVRTKIRFYRRPQMMEHITLTTWPELPGKLRANRDYVLEKDGELLAAGKTEWTILNTKDGRLHPVMEVFPPELTFWPETVWAEPFTRMTDMAMEDFESYTVRSTDIDLGGHMNNAAYIRMLAGAFSCEAWQSLNICEIEVAYRAPCYEGDTLTLQKKADGDTLLLRAALPDEKTVILARIVSQT